MITRIIRANLDSKLKKNFKLLWQMLIAKLINLQTKSRSLIVGKQHYDINNSLYQSMLDPEMNYTCGYWREANNLTEAQLAKLRLSCEKLKLKPGQRLLDIGCGWGGLAKYAATHYGVEVVGITISNEQLKLGQQRCKDLPVELRFQDYRDLNEKFDRIVSLGMFEHVGQKNYRHYMQVVHRCLNDDGLFLLHTIGSLRTNGGQDPWLSKYIFPNSSLPSAKSIAATSEGLFILEDWHNFGPDYDKTLMAWHHNFKQNWPQIQSAHDERFYRMWEFYLLCCAGLFRARSTQLWQIMLSKEGYSKQYRSIR